MRTIRTLVAAAGLTVIFAGAALAADPVTPTPFPAPTIGPVFVAAQTVTPDGALSSWFKPGGTVVFRAYAIDGKTQKVLLAKQVQYFYVTIPGQANVKLRYDPKAAGATPRLAWTGSWQVPASFAAGVVPFKVLVKTTAKRRGEFVQIPVAPTQLTISPTAPTPFAAGPVDTGTIGASSPLGIYADTVNGTAPAGAPTRTIGCTQTDVFKRGERVVVRSWGFDLKSGDVLTNENVDDAHFTVAGQPNVTLAWGGHGSTSKVWYWTNFWIIPADYALGTAVIHVSFTTDGGKTVSYDHPITVIP